MECTFHIDETAGLVVLRYTGKFGTDELVATIGQLTTDDELKRLRRRLHDLRAVAEPLEHTEVPGFAKALRTLLGPISDEERSRRVAIVAPSNPLFGTSRQLHALREAQGIERGGVAADLTTNQRVVRTFEEAVAWLGLPEGYPDPFPA